MKVNFDKSDRLMWLMYNSWGAIRPSAFDIASELKNSDNVEAQSLYRELVEITASDNPDSVKDEERKKAFAKYNVYLDEDYLVDEESFDEEYVINGLTEAHWQLVNHSGIEDMLDRCSDDKLAEILTIVHTEEIPFADTIVKIIKRQEPKLKDFKKEFWNNCPDVTKINEFCNIYRERLDLLENVDFTRYYALCRDYLGFSKPDDDENEFVQYFRDLRLCGLLQCDKYYAENRVETIASNLQSLRDGITKFFQQLRASSPPTMEGEMTEQSNCIKRAAKVQTAVLLEILKKAGITRGNADYAKIARLVSFLTGKSEKSIYNDTQKQIEFTNYHKKEIDEANKILQDIFSDLTIDINKKY